jgi:mucin-19
MTYTVGGLIEATDYNGFVDTGANNINKVWGTGTGDSGWGQTSISTVSAGGTVTATQWATLVANLATSGSQTGSTLTSRTQPVAGNTISILANVATDINTITNNRGNAAASGTEVGTFTGTTSKTTATGSGQAAWTITFTHTVTFASANAARFFFNAGGLVRLQYGKSSTGTDHDPDWNTLAGWCGGIFFSGRVNGTTNTIAGQAYTGTTRIGGTGGTQTTLATTTGYYSLTAGAAATTIFQLNNTTSPYTPEYIRTTVALNAGATVLTFVTTWVDDGSSGPGVTSNISGGTGVSSPATSIGAATAPTTLLTYRPPSTSFLTASWGTPTIAASVA